MTSGDKIRFFLEEDAVDKEGKLNRDKSKAVNKIGHGQSFVGSGASVHVAYQLYIIVNRIARARHHLPQGHFGK